MSGATARTLYVICWRRLMERTSGQMTRALTEAEARMLAQGLNRELGTVIHFWVEPEAT